MPTRAKRFCSYPGCSALSDGPYCEQHAKQAQHDYNSSRAADTYKVYGRRWRKIRKAFLAAHPLCEMCKRNGRTVPAEEVHHVLPVSEGGTHAASNLMALCKRCHSSITGQDVHGAKTWEHLNKE